jgi:hypothetical protein
MKSEKFSDLNVQVSSLYALASPSQHHNLVSHGADSCYARPPVARLPPFKPSQSRRLPSLRRA